MLHLSTYVLPLVKMANPQWNELETLYQVALRVYLVILVFPGYTATLTETQDKPFQLPLEEPALLQVERMSRAH